MKQITILFIALTFVSLTLKSQATFQSIASGNWTAPSTWTLTAGTSTLGYPTGANSDAIIVTGHTITINLTSISTKTLTIQSNAALSGNGKKLYINGDFTNHGRVISTGFNLYMTKAGANFYSPSAYTAPGTITAQKSFTIVAGSIINMRGGVFMQNTGTAIVNHGSVTFRNENNTTNLNGTVKSQFASNNHKWTNMAGSSLSMEAVPNLKTSLFNCSASSNTVTYTGRCSTVPAITYDNLTLTGTNNYTLTSNLNVNATLTTSLPIIPSVLSINLNNKKITLKGNFVSGARMLSQGNDTLLFTGTQALQTVSGTRTNTFARVIIDKPNPTDEILFTRTQNISKELVMIKGTCNASNSNLVLVSDATNTAYITKIDNVSDVNFTGNMVVQKHLPYYEGPAFDYFYRGLSSPVQSTTINDWDNELYISGIGPYDGISGPAGVDGNVYNGFASMLVYDEPSGAWGSLTGSTTTLTPGKGYVLLLMDSLNSGTSVGKSFAKTLTSVGQPNFGDVTMPVDLTIDGANMIGNPYASPINLSSGMTGSTIYDYYYLFDGNYLQGDLADDIPPHQSFLAYVDAPGDVVFTEDCKVADNTSVYYRKKPKYDVKLNISSNAFNFSHETSVCFDQKASIHYDKKLDARFIKTPTESLPAIFTIDELTNTTIQKNTVSDHSDELSLPIGIYTPKAGMYRINSAVINLGNYNYAWIENKVTGEKFDLNKDIAIEGKDKQTNSDFVLHFATKRTISSVDPTILTNDLLVFSTENTINLKSTFTDYAITSLFVYDMSGKLVLEEKDINVTAGQTSKVDVSHLSNGLYIIKSVDNQGKVNTHKLIK